MAAAKPGQITTKPKRKVEVEVPIEESDIKVVDIRLGELIALIAVCGTLAALGFTYYTYVKSKAESKKMESIAGVISAGIEGITNVLPKEPVNIIPKIIPGTTVKSRKPKNGARA